MYYRFSPYVTLIKEEKALRIFNSVNGFLCSITDPIAISKIQNIQNSLFFEETLPPEMFNELIQNNCIIKKDHPIIEDCINNAEKMFAMRNVLVVSVVLERDGKRMKTEDVPKVAAALKHYMIEKNIRKLHVEIYCGYATSDKLINMVKSFMDLLKLDTITFSVSLQTVPTSGLLEELQTHLTAVNIEIKYDEALQKLNEIVTLKERFGHTAHVALLCTTEEIFNLEVHPFPFDHSFSIIKKGENEEYQKDHTLTEIMRIEETKECNQTRHFPTWLLPAALVCKAAYEWYVIVDYDLNLKKCIEHLDEEQNIVGRIEDKLKFSEMSLFNYNRDSVINDQQCTSCPVLGLCYKMHCPWDTYFTGNNNCPIQKELISEYLLTI